MKKYITMKQVQNYLSYRRSLGYKLHIEGQELLKFGSYVDSKNHRGPLTEDIVSIGTDKNPPVVTVKDPPRRASNGLYF